MGAEPTGAAPLSGPGGQVIPLHDGITVRHAAFTRGDQAELADAALSGILAGRPKDFALYDAGEVYVYQPATGVYEMIPDYHVKSVVKSFAGDEIDDGAPTKGRGPTVVKVGASTTAGAYSLLRDDLRTDMDHRGGVTFATAAKGLCFANGFATIHDGKIEIVDHSPNHLARHRYEFDYSPDVTPKAFLEFLDSLFRDCAQKERTDRIATIQEYVGACLIGEATRYQRCLVVYATGGNGKSELMIIVDGLFPPGTVTSLPPHQWGHNFRVMMLEGKLINLVDEMPSDELTSGESFKKIVSGGQVDAERKQRDPVIFRPISGHIFNANQPLRSGDHSDGFWRRPLVLPLTRVFESAGYRAPELERGIGRRVLATDIRGIVSWAMEGAARLQKQGAYTESAESKAYVIAWRDESDQVRGFFAEQPITGRISQSVLYTAYTTWAKENGHKPLSRVSFGQRIISGGLGCRIKSSTVFYEPPADPAEKAEREAMQAEEAPAEGDVSEAELSRLFAESEAERLACG